MIGYPFRQAKAYHYEKEFPCYCDLEMLCPRCGEKEVFGYVGTYLFRDEKREKAYCKCGYDFTPKDIHKSFKKQYHGIMGQKGILWYLNPKNWLDILLWIFIGEEFGHIEFWILVIPIAKIIGILVALYFVVHFIITHWDPSK